MRRSKPTPSAPRPPARPDAAPGQADAGGWRGLERARNRLPRRTVRSALRGAARGLQRFGRHRRKLHLSLGRRSRVALSRQLAARKQRLVFRMRSRAWDRRSLHFLECHEEQFGEIAATAASTSRFRFSAPSLPPSPKALPIAAWMEALSSTGPRSAREELASLHHRARHRRDGRRSAFPGCADGARGETGDRSDPTGRHRRGAAA